MRWWSTCTRSTSEALSPRTVVTENVCESVQQILQHSPPIMPFLTTSTLTDAPMHTPKATKSETLNSPNLTPSISCPLAVQCGGRRPPESLAGALQDWSTSEVFSPRTVLTENICRRVQKKKNRQKNKWPGNNGLSNNLYNNPFLPGFSSSPG